MLDDTTVTTATGRAKAIPTTFDAETRMLTVGGASYDLHDLSLDRRDVLAVQHAAQLLRAGTPWDRIVAGPERKKRAAGLRERAVAAVIADGIVAARKAAAKESGQRLMPADHATIAADAQSRAAEIVAGMDRAALAAHAKSAAVLAHIERLEGRADPLAAVIAGAV